MKKLFLIVMCLTSSFFAKSDNASCFFNDYGEFNLCHDHFKSSPESLFNYDITSHEPKLANGDNPCIRARSQKELIKEYKLNLSFIPLCKSQCNYTFCKSCQKTVLKGIGLASEDDGCYEWHSNLDDDFELEEFYKCNCLKDWSSDYQLEVESEEWFYENDDDDVDNFSRPSRDWQKCSNQAVYSCLLDIDTNYQAINLKSHLLYLEQNTSCNCYWQFKNPLAAKIGNKVYEYFDKFLDNSFLKHTDDLKDIDRKFPQFKNLTSFGISCHEFVHTVFYSQYRERLLTWGLWDETYNQDNTQIIRNLNTLYKTIDQISPDFYSLYTECLKNHPHPKIYFERGMISFHKGDYLNALEDIQNFIQSSSFDDKLIDAEIYFNEGTIYSELGLYEKAVEALTKAINKDPRLKEAYLERAACYFELGQFDSCIEDYLTSGIKRSCDEKLSENNYQFWVGLTQGIIKAGSQAGCEYIPSLLSATYGIGQGLWAFSQSPVQMSVEFIQSVKGLILFIKKTTPLNLLTELAPELKILINQWDSLDEQTRGYHVGAVIGKYGVEIFAGASLSKGISLYKQLKKANNLLLYESMALNKEVNSLIKIEALKRFEARKSILKSSNLKIQWDKQGKHIQGHRNYDPKKSIFEHKDPQGLIDKYAGSGIKVRGTPGTSGYQEIINFEEFIGYEVSDFGNKKTHTTWGKIHYADDGVHIVPTKPRVIWTN